MVHCDQSASQGFQFSWATVVSAIVVACLFCVPLRITGLQQVLLGFLLFACFGFAVWRCVTAWPKSTFLAACRLVVMLLITGSALIVGIWTVARNAVENRASAAAIQLTLDEDGRFSDVEVSLVGCPTSQVLTVHGTVNSAADLTELKEFIRPLEFKRRVRWRVRIDLTNKVPQRIREKQLSDVSASQLVRTCFEDL